MQDQTGEPGNNEIAAGYAIKASPTPFKEKNIT
jgi:hypothetical protein